MPAEAGIKFGHYVLLRRLARGGMAEVFLAQQRGLEGFDRRVAIKRILPHLADSSDFVRMFLAEAKLAAQLSHPNIVHIYEFGKVDHDYFIAMEYVDGVHAGQLMRTDDDDNSPFPPRELLSPTLVARIGADAAAALHHAHELRAVSGKPLGLVHRDVSPANIMISYDGVVKLCDFGIAKAAAVSDQLTNPGQVKGKYAYMSPEQTVAQPLDGRSDVFSLAIVLWELLAGRFLVPRGDAVAAMRAIRDGKFEPLEEGRAVDARAAGQRDRLGARAARQARDRHRARAVARGVHQEIARARDTDAARRVGASAISARGDRPAARARHAGRARHRRSARHGRRRVDPAALRRDDHAESPHRRIADRRRRGAERTGGRHQHLRGPGLADGQTLKRKRFNLDNATGVARRSSTSIRPMRRR